VAPGREGAMRAPSRVKSAALADPALVIMQDMAPQPLVDVHTGRRRQRISFLVIPLTYQFQKSPEDYLHTRLGCGPLLPQVPFASVMYSESHQEPASHRSPPAAS
jgi:hypothetical protein